MRKTILAFGETLWDILPSGAKLGGAPFNFVYRVNSLGDLGVMVSRLGRDELGQEAMEKIRSLGMSTDCIQCDETRPTGRVEVSFDEANNPDYVIIPSVAYDHIETTDALLSVAAEADCFCFGTLIQRSGKSRQTLYRMLDAANRAVKLLDINLRRNCFSIDTVTASLKAADILKLNDAEALQLARMLEIPDEGVDVISQRLIEQYALDCCVVTLGNRGALAMSARGKKSYVPGYKVSLADSLGSGDAFTAGFINKYIRGSQLAECCRYGNALGAIVATHEGATSPVSKEDISDFLTSARNRICDPVVENYAVQ